MDVIDAIKLAEAFIEEARTRVEKTDYGGEPDLTFAEKWRRATAEHPMPDVKSLAAVIEAVFWATTLAEERRPCRPRLVYTAPAQRSDPAHVFAVPEPLTAQAIRKLAPAHASVGYLSWDVINGEPTLTGIRQGHKKECLDVSIVGPAPGAINLSWVYERLLSFSGGQMRRRFECGFAGSTVVSALASQTLNNVTASLVFSAIDEVLEAGHGGSFWIAGDRSKLPGVHIGRALLDDPRPLLERFTGSNQLRDRRHWLAHVARLSAVDGAVLLDGGGSVLGFGCFIDLPGPVPIRWITPTVEERITTSFDMFSGGRHRSAVQFCSSCGPAAAIVVSEDGRMIAMAGTGAADPVFCAEVVTLGMFGGTNVSLAHMKLSAEELGASCWVGASLPPLPAARGLKATGAGGTFRPTSTKSCGNRTLR